MSRVYPCDGFRQQGEESQRALRNWNLANFLCRCGQLSAVHSTTDPNSSFPLLWHIDGTMFQFPWWEISTYLVGAGQFRWVDTTEGHYCRMFAIVLLLHSQNHFLSLEEKEKCEYWGKFLPGALRKPVPGKYTRYSNFVHSRTQTKTLVLTRNIGMSKNRTIQPQTAMTHAPIVFRHRKRTLFSSSACCSISHTTMS